MWNSYNRLYIKLVIKMIDITLKDEEKDSFITRVYLKEGSDKYVICYASGRQEEVLFSIPNLNESFLKMEQQFLEHKDSFIDSSLQTARRANLNKLIEAFVAVGALFITSVIDIPMLLKVLIIMISALFTLCFQQQQSALVADIENNLRVVSTAEEFLKRKNDFIIKVTDPMTNLEEDWYLLTLSDIESLYNPEMIKQLADTITPEMKKEESMLTVETLKKRMRLGNSNA